MEKWIKEYLENLQFIRGYSQNTIFGYQHELETFKSYLEAHHLSFTKLSKQDIWAYLEVKNQENLQKSSMARHLTALRSFYDFLVLKKVLDSNVFKSIHNPKLAKHLPNALNYDEIRTLLQFDELKTPRDFMIRVIFELLYATGMRVSELADVKVKDIFLTEQMIRTIGKGNKERIVYFGDYAKEALEEYLPKRKELLVKGPIDYLLVNQRGGRLSRSSIEKIVQQTAVKKGLIHHVSPHTLRHTFATHMIEGGADIRTVQELLGHEKLSTTQIYTHLSSAYLRQEYLKKMPRK